MSAFARIVAALIALAVAACAFLPWVGSVSSWHLHLRSMFSIGDSSGATYATSIGTLVAGAALIILIGALGNGRTLVIVGGLLAVAVPCIWIFGNAVSHTEGAIALSRVQIGAYGAAVGGFMALILAAVATDTSVPSLR